MKFRCLNFRTEVYLGKTEGINNLEEKGGLVREGSQPLF